jgi:hypothetical protein
MKQSELQQIKDFYENTILQGIIRPLHIDAIYQFIVPTETNPKGIAYKIKQRAIAVFVQNKQWEVLKMVDDLFVPVDKHPIDLQGKQLERTDNPKTAKPDNVLTNDEGDNTLKSIGTIENKHLQSHSEDDDLKSQSKDDISGGQSSDLTPVKVSGVITKEQLEEAKNNLLSDEEQQEKLQARLAELEAEYATSIDSSRKRSISMQLSHLKKKLNK